MDGLFGKSFNVLVWSVVSFFLVALVQGCNCYSGWGYSAISKSGYFRQPSLADSTKYFKIMRQLSTEFSELIPNSLDEKEYKINANDSVLGNEYIRCPTCLTGKECVCIHHWFLIARKKEMIFDIGLYDDGFAITRVYIKEHNETKHISAYDLCELKRKDRKKLYQQILNSFETEILPVMEPYFDRIKKR